MKIDIKEYPWDLVIAMVLAALLLGVALTAQTGTLRILLGLAFMLFLPGYVIVSALFPKAKDLNIVERIALSFGLSMAVVPLIGLILNYSPWGARLYVILISLFILIISISIIAWYRRIQIPVDERFYINIIIEKLKPEEITSFDKILTFLLVIALIITVSVLFFIIIVPKEADRYTEFYILDENRKSENYPTNLTIGETGMVVTGVFCHEHERSQYTVEIELINLTGERENRTLGQYNFILEHNQRNETFFNFNVSDSGTYKLQFRLYLNGINEPYRELHLWIDIKP